ncbi:MAG: polysaccharide biosynthesis/export family protein [Alphaproteobacteria bacterium]|nr:polysaccharide biosynthesis/export family protein [Alphaproteobacteria bacterium]
MKAGPFIAVLLAGFTLCGCSAHYAGLFPGMGFNGALPRREAWVGRVGRYEVMAITPSLLLAQALARKQVDVGRANAALNEEVAGYRYLVQPRDVLSIAVWGDPTKTMIFTPMAAPGSTVTSAPAASGFKVNPDGTIYFPYAGTVAVAGQTTEEIRADLARRMTPYIQNPQITVDVAQFNSQNYQVAGVVAKPGLYPITDSPMTVSKAIALAGGVPPQIQSGTSNGNAIARPLGDLSRVLFVHDRGATLLDLHALEANGDRSQDRLVGPGDVIRVPDDSFEQVHVIGEVHSPGNYTLNGHTLNLSQALGDAGEVDLATADTARIFVFRGAYEHPQIFWLDASSPDAMLLANGFQLEPQDVVYVATAGLVSWDRVINQILPTVQTVYFTKVMTQ